MSGALIVRAVAPTDLSQWAKLWDGYNAHYERTLAEEITRATWARFFDVSEPVHCLVAERGGELLGFTHYLFHRSTSMISRTCYLQDLFTAKAARGKGVGRALIEAVYERAAAEGSLRVYWQTHETNATAMKLYDKVAKRSGFLVYSKDLPPR
ncbi:MAG TPA: GNAT family N-acetyltransferase [Chthoniobacterales bacterium]